MSHPIPPPRPVPLPNLRFNDGDVIIKLSNNDRENPILHSAKLASVSDVFKNSFDPKWATPRPRQHPVTGQQVLMFTLTLVCKDGAFFLESKTNARVDLKPTWSKQQELEEYRREHGMYAMMEDPPADMPKTFAESDWHCYDFEEAWMTEGPSKAGTDSARDLRCLFALLYDLPLAYAHLKPGDCDITNQMSSGSPDILEKSDRVASILAYAQFYQCEDLVAEKLGQLLMSQDRLWRTVQGFAERFWKLGKALSCREIQIQAVREMLLWPTEDAPTMAELLQKPVDEIQILMEGAKEERDIMKQKLEKALLSLSLTPVQALPLGCTHPDEQETFRTSTTNARDHGAGPGKDKLTLRTEGLAEKIWSQYLIPRTHKNGVKVILSKARSDSVAVPVDSFNDTCLAILEAAKSRKPSGLFGNRVPEKTAELWTDDRQQAAALTQKLHAALNDVVKEAAKIIDNHFAEKCRKGLCANHKADDDPDCAMPKGSQNRSCLVPRAWGARRAFIYATIHEKYLLGESETDDPEKIPEELYGGDWLEEEGQAQ